MPNLVAILIAPQAGDMRFDGCVLITHSRKITHHQVPWQRPQTLQQRRHPAFPSSEPDRIERDIDPVVLKHSVAKHLPFTFSSSLMRAVQALIRTGELFSHGSMHVDPEAFAESPHARAIVRGHPIGIAQRGHVNGVRLRHAHFLLIRRQLCVRSALSCFSQERTVSPSGRTSATTSAGVSQLSTRKSVPATAIAQGGTSSPHSFWR
ncbi:hypothetical protein [Paraburkholderia sp. J8-2]|uniref:hypothetical protein n=1 Tax=Paraburkholderia sp. J8-2 TaxID=2805440 RepID=UPI002AB6516B|nr:hypothetical protein [Paraburkholderia sp. J8-2]